MGVKLFITVGGAVCRWICFFVVYRWFLGIVFKAFLMMKMFMHFVFDACYMQKMAFVGSSAIAKAFSVVYRVALILTSIHYCPNVFNPVHVGRRQV